MDDPRKILIVDDEPGFRKTYRDLFEHHGHEVKEAENGQAGLDLATSWRPDLILLDLVMPVMTGYEMLERLSKQKTTADIPVIIFSVLGEQSDIQKALELGAADYIVKGFYSPGEVLGKVGKFLAKAQFES